VDYRCCVDNSVVTRAGEQLHDGRFYPYFDRDRDYCSVGQDHSGQKNRLADDVRTYLKIGFASIIRHARERGHPESPEKCWILVYTGMSESNAMR
jgi:hypothetical protein